MLTLQKILSWPLELWRNRAPRLWFLFFFGWMTFALFLSSLRLPISPDVPGGLPLDKFAHLFLYGMGAVPLYRFLDTLGSHNQRRYLANWLLTIVLLAGFGALDEFFQTFTPDRSGNDVGDWIADVTGAICVATATALWLRYRRHISHRHDQ